MRRIGRESRAFRRHATCVPPRSVRHELPGLVVLLLTPACALVAPFDENLLNVDETAEAGEGEGEGGEGEGGAEGEGGEGEGGGEGGEGEGEGEGEGGAGAGVALGGDCTADEVRACYPRDAGEIGLGICQAGTQRCDGGGNGGPTWGECLGAVTPAAETCDNGVDDDCDGAVDEGCVGLVEQVWCWSCAGINLFTDNAACGLAAVPANDDGTCPEGSSLEPPAECEPCRVCTVTQGFCETPECCGDWQENQTVGEGCQCWGCPGQGVSTDVNEAISAAEDAGIDFCEYMPAEYDSACGDYLGGCYVRSCGAAADCR